LTESIESSRSRAPRPCWRAGRFAFLTDDLAEPFKLARHPLIHLDDFVERVGDFPVDAFQIDRQARREVAPL